MRDFFFTLFKKIGRPLSGIGLARLPFASFLYRSVYSRLKPEGIIEVSGAGHTLLINSKDTGLTPPLLMQGMFAPAETKLFEDLLRPGMVFVDIGANIGYFSLIAARKVSDKGMVYAFEPDAEHFSLLEKNIKKNGYSAIIPVKKAASDTTGTASFYLQKDNLCAHSLVPDENTSVVEVETVTLDEYFLGQDHIDVVKIDVEGAELKVLRGMKQIISKNNKLAIITEFFPQAIIDSGESPSQYLQDLVAHGFTLFRIDEDKAKNLSPITKDMIPLLSKGEGMGKLLNILCLKNWDIGELRV